MRQSRNQTCLETVVEIVSVFIIALALGYFPKGSMPISGDAKTIPWRKREIPSGQWYYY